MLEKPDRSYTNHDDDVQIAACVAAVYAYMAAEDESGSLPVAEAPGASGWASEALLEGAHGAAKIVRPLPAGLRRNPWFGAGLKLFICLQVAGAALFAPPAPADAEGEYGDRPAFQPAPANGAPPTESPFTPTLLRVGIVAEAQAIALGIADGAEVCDRATGTVVAWLSGQGRWTVTCKADTLAFTAMAQQSPASILPYREPIRPVGFRFPAAPPASAFALRITAQVPADRTTAQAPADRTTAQTPADRTTAQAPADRTTAQAPALHLGAVPEAPDGALKASGPGAGGYVVVPPQPDGLIAVNGRLYRGIIWIQKSLKATGKIAAINVVDLEDYLLSVVPAEMPSGWPLEALKAQAIVARSYALANRGKHESRGFDVKATAEDQVYSGVSSETESTNQAVAETSGIIVEHEGKPASAFFHSTSGGFTEVAEFVWGGSAPFLHAVPDYDDASPHFSWSRKFTPADLDKALSGSGQDAGEVMGMFVVSRAPSMRARQVLVVGSRETKLVGADTVRRLLKLPSTNFNVGCLPDCYEFAGRGFGHGLGMSQWGARALAERGYNAAQILKYYYKDVALDYHEAIRLSDGRSMAASLQGERQLPNPP